MSSDYVDGDNQAAVEGPVIKLCNVSKCYHLYDKPHHRFMQSLFRSRKQYYKEFWALEDASFEIARGQTVGIIGGNGAGKSTLLQILAGTLEPTTGSVEINGRVTALLELGAGFNPEFTGIENILLNGTIYGLSSQEIESKLNEIVKFADIGDFINQPVKTYSSGMYVRLAFAIQANFDPDIFIVDEALAVGDARFVHKCMLRFHQLKERGTTILLVTHDATAVRALCERVIWLNKGKLLLDGSPQLVVDKYLASSRQQPVVDVVNKAELSGGGGPYDSVSAAKSHETLLPNIDQRYGNQVCSISGAALYDKDFHKTDIVSNGTDIILRITFTNNSLPEFHPVILGYSLRNNRGIDLASNNSEIEGIEIAAPARGSEKTASIIIKLPLLHPGPYAFTISVNYRDSDGGMNNADSLSNLIVFDVVSNKVIHVLMSLDTKFVIEDL